MTKYSSIIESVIDDIKQSYRSAEKGKMNKSLYKYCVGCGLCKAFHKATICVDTKGYYHPQNGEIKWLKSVCPAGGKHIKHLDHSNIWGKSIKIFSGWSNNETTRREASSGGVLTEICSFLLDCQLVDGIIHIAADPNTPYKNQTVISYTSEQVRSRCGSRYSISHPLEIIDSIDKSKKYALIGKPCDIDALHNYFEINPHITKTIVFTFSFLCMGLPSDKAQMALLNKMGCSSKKCKKISYRGNGWPGFATVVDSDDKISILDYDNSWGKVLGRDLMPCCRFCADGVGELADISCGDYWYIKDGKPDFAEHEGRNVIFVRSQKGMDIIRLIQDASRITLCEEEDYQSYLSIIQKSQLERRQSLVIRLIALTVLRQPRPKYLNKHLYAYSSELSLKRKIRIFLGTCKRILQGKI